MMNLFEVARNIADRLTRIFLRDAAGRQPVFGGAEKIPARPHWRDSLLFYEYFHGDNGAGIGASHQTGWTGLVGALVISSAISIPSIGPAGRPPPVVLAKRNVRRCEAPLRLSRMVTGGGPEPGQA
jgi:hypothetical protein